MRYEIYDLTLHIIHMSTKSVFLGEDRPEYAETDWGIDVIHLSAAFSFSPTSRFFRGLQANTCSV